MRGIASRISNGDRQCMGMGTGTSRINRMIITGTCSSPGDTGWVFCHNLVICGYRVCVISTCACSAACPVRVAS